MVSINPQVQYVPRKHSSHHYTSQHKEGRFHGVMLLPPVSDPDLHIAAEIEQHLKFFICAEP